jgi:F-type H+-transporting ATPase subunit b
MRQGFGLNTNLFETNLLNLSVVIAIVVTVVGDAFSEILAQRQKRVMSALQDADRKSQDAQKRWEDAEKSIKAARLRAQDIRRQAIQAVEQENRKAKEQLEIDLQRLRERGEQAIKLEYRRTVQIINKKVVTLALITAESTLRTTLCPQDQSSSKQVKLNDLYVSETFSRL